ncbi:265_t:CDS:10 [Ambispora leptoticha]|uniref:Large ribosomal subunit protein uL4m n=1 Tax=Ambispora leptoticha TaxID=144679 RepID=A0A9N8W1X4_9GLOM|nr:265_t:CDS:10 [Ambispora leptoticha]
MDNENPGQGALDTAIKDKENIKVEKNGVEGMNNTNNIGLMNSMTEMLQTNVLSIQNSFSSVYTTLAENLKQSLEIMHVMNSAMEQLLTSNCRIETNIIPIHKNESAKREEGKTKTIPSLLEVTVSNASQFPIANGSLKLIFINQFNKKEEIVVLECINSLKRKINDSIAASGISGSTRSRKIHDNNINREEDDETVTMVSSLITGDNDNGDGSNFVISPFTKITETFRITPPNFAPYDVRITLFFPSPGTRKYLQVNHVFGMNLIDQCEKHLHYDTSTSSTSSILQTLSDLSSTTSIKISPNILRKLWNVHQSVGLDERLCFELIVKSKLNEKDEDETEEHPIEHQLLRNFATEAPSRPVIIKPQAISPLPSRLEAWLRDFQTNELLDVITLDRHVFGVPIRRDILHRVVVWQRDNWRQGTHSTKTRSEVSGSTRKVAPQKGRGKARVSTRRAPQFVGGGRAHGPRPRSHATDLPRQVRELGLRVALSSKYAQDQLYIVNNIDVPKAKTKELTDILNRRLWDPLAIERRAGHSIMFVGANRTRNFELAQRNLQRVHYSTAQEILEAGDVYNIIGHEVLVLDQGALKELELLLNPYIL